MHSYDKGLVEEMLMKMQHGNIYRLLKSSQKKGFVSFDKYELANPKDNRYIPVAWPIFPNVFNLNVNFPLDLEYPELDFRNIDEHTIVDISDYID